MAGLYEATEPGTLSAGVRRRECQIIDCARRCSGLLVFGQGFDPPRLHHNCTAILIQCVSGLRCSSFLSKPLCHRGFQALLHESPSLHPLRKPRKLVPTGVEPFALLHDCFLKGALLHDCSELSCNSGRRILGLFPSGEGNRRG